MLKKMKWGLLFVVAFTTISAITINNDKLFEISKNLEIFVKVYKELNTNFADEIDPGTLMRTAIDAMVNSLDPYTNFVSESQIESYRITQDEKYQGIGARVGLVGNVFTILEPYEGGPAVTSGLKAGDQIIEIDGINIAGKTLEEINTIVRGVPGTDVNFRIKKGGKNEELIKLTRGEVNIPNVPYSGMVSDNIGYVSLTTFTQNAGANISKALKEMKQNNPNLGGIIIDLRQNGGGLLHEAINICNIFMPMGETLVTTKSKIKERDQSFKTTMQPVDLEIPVAVLIDKRSASASEIVSGVFQDMDRGVILGQRSFGKGLVQNTKNVGYNSILKLTTSKYYIPSGRCIQGVAYENGEPKDIPDNLRSKFKTKNGREVLDGGGVTPDVKIEVPHQSELVKALLEKYVIFNFVTQYIQNIDSIASAKTYQFNDYDKFSVYVKGLNFTYETEADKNLTKMKKQFEESNQTSLVAEVKSLEEKIAKQKAKSWENHKLDIIKEIEKEIVTRYYFQSGKVQLALDKDIEIKEAISVLNDQSRYKKILNKQK